MNLPWVFFPFFFLSQRKSSGCESDWVRSALLSLSLKWHDIDSLENWASYYRCLNLLRETVSFSKQWYGAHTEYDCWFSCCFCIFCIFFYFVHFVVDTNNSTGHFEQKVLNLKLSFHFDLFYLLEGTGFKTAGSFKEMYTCNMRIWHCDDEEILGNIRIKQRRVHLFPNSCTSAT